VVEDEFIVLFHENRLDLNRVNTNKRYRYLLLTYVLKKLELSGGEMLRLFIITISISGLLLAGDFGYIGSAACGKCHKSSKKGAQLKAWEKGPHAGAFETLKSEEAAKIAAEKELTVPAYEASECLKCHVTGWNDGGYEIKDAEFYAQVNEKGKPTKEVKRMAGLQAVGCESCHGAGSEYKKVHKKDYETSLTLGLVTPDEKVCVTCHNEESPTYKEFNYEEKVTEITHPFPEGMERKNRK